MRARLTAAAIALTTVIGAALGSGTAAAVPVAPALPFPVPPAIPEFDRDFYLPSPATYVDKAPGELIAARRVHLSRRCR